QHAQPRRQLLDRIQRLYLPVHMHYLRQRLGKTSARLRDTVGVWQVRLYIDDRRAIEQIGTADMQTHTVAAIDALQRHHRQSDRVGAMRGARRKYALLFVAAQSRWTHQWLPRTLHDGVKNK